MRPIGKRLMGCLTQAAQAKKIRLNVELGKQMMQEIKFYVLDPHEIGELTEDEFKEKNNMMQQLIKS